jgi:hypothetical protein
VTYQVRNRRVLFITGSRDSSLEQRRWLIAELAARKPDLVLVGDNRDSQKNGRHRYAFDEQARCWCRQKGVQCSSGLAAWESLDLKAGPLRNESMVHIAAALKAFGDDVFALAAPGEGTGTKGAIRLVKHAGIAGLVCDPTGNVVALAEWKP